MPLKTDRRALWIGGAGACFTAVALVSALGTSTAMAASGFERTGDNPRELRIERPVRPYLIPPAKGKGAAVQSVPNGEADLTLTIDYTDPAVSKIFNPSTNSYDAVKLRTYNGAFVAPTIRVRPGETARVSLENRLPAEDCVLPESGMNTPHCFNKGRIEKTEKIVR